MVGVGELKHGLASCTAMVDWTPHFLTGTKNFLDCYFAAKFSACFPLFKNSSEIEAVFGWVGDPPT